MQSVWERRKLRQEYLKKRKDAIDASRASFACAVGCVVLLCFVVTMSQRGHDVGLKYATWMFLVPLFTGALMFHLWGYRHFRRELKAVDRTSYAPPVGMNSPEEILVRGSEQPPVAQSEVLLRAAQMQEQETPAEELLRVSQE
jgi:uncharacterized integral membrane protein